MSASTKAYGPLKELYKAWDGMYRSAVGSGMVGDDDHRRRGGYHIGRAFQSDSNYSVIRPDDRDGPADSTTAIDYSMHRADMILCTQRLRAVWLDKSDPRRKYINAFNGWSGTGDAIRYDFVSGKKSRASADHKWHVHLEIRRRWCLSVTAHQAIASILRGQNKTDYIKSINPPPAATRQPKPNETPSKATPVRSRTAPSFPATKVLKLGTTNDPHLKAWQTQMLARGYKSLGKADGDFGPKTKAVCIAYQKLCKVTPDGVIGRITFPLAWTRPQ